MLDTPQQLAAWPALEGDRLHTEAGDSMPTESDLVPVHAVRAHTEAVLHALLHGTMPPEAGLRALTDAQRAAPAVRELAWDGTTVTTTVRRSAPSASVSPPAWPRPPPTFSPTPRSAGSSAARPTTA
ncbi:ABATE domain-containing protein [Streptomyces thinghirensis]|uniref:ABATE domain-containing protein n=1 Tax=Streptomyces thinghirensis TaxID=551547 RepID=UPI0031E5968B